MTSEEKKLKIKSTERTFRELATDSAISGPTPDGFYHLSFLHTRIDLISQTKIFDENDEGHVTMSLDFSPDDSEITRELVGQVSMPQGTTEAMFGAVAERLILIHGVEYVDSLLKTRGLTISQVDADEKSESD